MEMTIGDGEDVVKATFLIMPSLMSDQVRYSCPATAKFRHGSRRSKAQMHLLKIMHIIKSVPSQETQIEDLGGGGNENRFCGTKGFGVDLNLRLGPFPDDGCPEAENGGLSACSGVGRAVETGSTAVSDDGVLTVEKSSEGGSDSVPDRNGEEPGVVEEKTTEIRNLEGSRSDTDNNGKVMEEARKSMIREGKTKPFQGKSDNGYLGLLVEAAKLISGNFVESESESDPQLRVREGSRVINEESKGQKRKRTEESYRGLGDVSPVVKSKRGRTQVLPSRYRDSVREPLQRLARSTVVSAKRRSRK